LYGVKSGTAVKSDESLQSGWSPLGEFEGPMSKVFGDLDKTAVYGLDSKNSLSRCANGTCKPVDTPGTPQDLSIDTKGNLWMTTTTQGLKGNVYTKTDSTEIPDTSELDKQRDAVVREAELNKQKTSVSKVMEEVLQFFKNLLKQPEHTKPEEDKIIRNKEYVDRMQKIIPAMLRILIYIGAVAILYICFGWLDWITHLAAIAILGYGVYDVYLQTKQ
jgi:hypothetical protein